MMWIHALAELIVAAVRVLSGNGWKEPGEP